MPEPPANGGFMIAAYIVTAVVLLAYTWKLWAEVRKREKAERAE